MLTHDEAAQLAAQKLGVENVRPDHLTDWTDWSETLLCFTEDRPWSLQEYDEALNRYIGDYFCLIDAATGIAIGYDSRRDWEYDSAEAGANFTTGLHSQFYRLEIFDVRDWDKTRRLFQATHLHTDNLVLTLPNAEPSTHWLTMNLAPLEAELGKNGALVFLADINGYYRFLQAGRFFGCFDYRLFAYDRETQAVGAEIFPFDEFYRDDFVNSYSEEDEEKEEFWESLDWGPVVAAKGF